MLHFPQFCLLWIQKISHLLVLYITNVNVLQIHGFTLYDLLPSKNFKEFQRILTLVLNFSSQLGHR